MNKLDLFVKDIKSNFDKGREAKVSPDYKRLDYLRQKALKNEDPLEANRVLKEMQKIRARLPNDPGFRRLYYVRYADDWIIAIRGTRTETIGILKSIREYLKETLKLDLSLEKTLVTNPRSESALFLGTQIKISQHTYFHRGKNGHRLRAVSQLIMCAPLDRIYKKLESAGF